MYGGIRKKNISTKGKAKIDMTLQVNGHGFAGKIRKAMEKLCYYCVN